MHRIEVIKKDTSGNVVHTYVGTIIDHYDQYILVEAFFDFDEITQNDFTLIRGDKFLEVYSPTKWFNIFEIFKGQSSQIKGWYCNITTPAIIKSSSIEYIDLAIDLLVYPNSEQRILDIDEFQMLNIPPTMKLKGLDALEELQRFFSQNRQDILQGKSMMPHIKDWLRYS